MWSSGLLVHTKARRMGSTPSDSHDGFNSIPCPWVFDAGTVPSAQIGRVNTVTRPRDWTRPGRTARSPPKKTRCTKVESVARRGIVGKCGTDLARS